jgi:hypothetical protein
MSISTFIGRENEELLDRIDLTVAVYKFILKSNNKNAAVHRRPEGNGE